MAEDKEHKTAPQHLNSLQVARGTWRLLLALAGVAILLFILSSGYAVWLTARSNGLVSGADSALKQTPAPTPLTPASAQKEIKAAVDASIARDEALLDKLVLLVGIYSTILSILALATVFVSRQEAKEQLASVRANADTLADDVGEELDKIQNKAQDLAAGIEKQLETIRATAAQDVAALKREVTREFPIISRLQNRVLDLIARLEAKYPEDENLNRLKPSSWKNEEKHQDILIDEAQILAISVVVLDDASLVRLYLLLAKSYLEQFRTGKQTDSDAARAYLYAGRAIACDRQNPEAYRMRGLISLSRYNSSDKQNSEEFRDLLQQAKQDFLQCISLDPANAGALYNLALIGMYEGNFDEAIRVSEELLAARDSVPRSAKEKYLPDVFINLACFLADKAKTLRDEAAQYTLYKRILSVCTEAEEYLSAEVKSSKAMENFKTSLARELGEKGDFGDLPPDTRGGLADLL